MGDVYLLLLADFMGNAINHLVCKQLICLRNLFNPLLQDFVFLDIYRCFYDSTPSN